MSDPNKSPLGGLAAVVGNWYQSARRALRSAYTRELEAQLARERDEVTRQRAENDRQRDEIARERSELTTARDEIARQAADLAQEREATQTLRAENRALLNSLLGTVGVPPIETLTARPVQIAPIRRRSWNQIAKTREIESARKPSTSAEHKSVAKPPV